MRIFLVRHAQTAWNALGKAQGSIDIPLDDVGLNQAELLASSLVEKGLQKIIASDLLRSAQTAEAVVRATGAELKLDPRLREVNLGDWEGRPFPEVRADMASLAQPNDPYHINCCPPNGESLGDVWRRVAPVAEEIRSYDEPTLIVSHGGTAGLLLSRLLCGTPEQGRAYRFANTGLCELEPHRLIPYCLVRYNCTAHLQGNVALAGSLEGTHRA